MSSPLPALGQSLAAALAANTLSALDREYRNLIHHVMSSDAELAPPRRLTPVFYGCFDWHSAVHGHWMLLRLARLFPGAPFARSIMARLDAGWQAEALATEAGYLAHPERAGFERPYGLAWLLTLIQELDEWATPPVLLWRERFRPLERIALRRLEHWIPRLPFPIRSGEHSQTAFAFGLIHDYASGQRDHALLPLLVEFAQRFHRADRDAPLAWEPSGHDFLSPSLAEADFMRRVLDPADFAVWLADFLPGIGQPGWLHPVVPGDRDDGKLVHLDGLNLSRAWMLDGIASALSPGDARRPALLEAARQHIDAGLAGLVHDHYAGRHWLGSFAVYALSRRGIHSL